MTKLRARLLVPLVLAAVALLAIGVGTSRAAGRADHASHSRGSFARPPQAPMSGEPDGGGHTSTPTVHTSAIDNGLGPWLALAWYQWLVERQQRKPSGGH